MANAFMNMNSLATPENAEKYAFLKDDPDLAVVWEDVKNNGPVAMQKVGWLRKGTFAELG